jgi:hypothetical protein
MLYEFIEDEHHTGHIQLIYTQLGRSDRHPNWSFRYIYDGPHLQQYIDTAVEQFRSKPVNTDYSVFTVEGIMNEGYV